MSSSSGIVKRIDHVKVFNLYVFFGGDKFRTAESAGCTPALVEALAHDFCWADKITGRSRLDTPDGLKREQEHNRAANYYVAKQLMDMLTSIVCDATTDPENWTRVNCVELDEQGNKTFSPKPLLEIAKAAQAIQDMTYRALGDKLAGKADTSDPDAAKISNFSVNLYAGLEKLGKAAKQVDRVVDVTPHVEKVTGTEHGAFGNFEQ